LTRIRRNDPRFALATIGASGWLLTFSQAPWGIWPLAFGALFIFFIASSRHPGSRTVVNWGFPLFCSAYAIGASRWAVAALDRHNGNSAFESNLYVGVLLFVAVLAGTLVWRALLRAFPNRDGAALIVLALGAFIAVDLLIALMFGGFTWHNLGYALMDSPLQDLLTVAGVHGGSLLILIVAGVVARAFVLYGKSLPTLFHFAGVVTVISICLVCIRIWDSVASNEPQNLKKLEVSVVSANVMTNEKWEPRNLNSIVEKYARLIERVPSSSQLVLLPETPFPLALQQIGGTRQMLESHTRDRDRTIFWGVIDRQGTPGRYRIFNAAAATRGGQTEVLYRKRTLAPLVESLPDWKVLSSLRKVQSEKFPPFTASVDQQRAFVVSGGVLGIASICFEDAFPSHFSAGPDAHVVLNFTNDAWFEGTSMPDQHLRIARTRALELGVPMIRASNSGRSAIIDSYGRALTVSPVGEASMLTYTMTTERRRTIYSLMGANVSAIFVLAVATILIAVFVGRRKPQEGQR
jgi:apolipoprotein N-acyltransferase